MLLAIRGRLTLSMALAVIVGAVAWPAVGAEASAPTGMAAEQVDADYKRDLAAAGFKPLADYAAQGEQVQRAYSFNYHSAAFSPGVSLVRARDGSVTIQISRDGTSETFSARVKTALWDQFLARDTEVFVPPPTAPLPASAPLELIRTSLVLLDSGGTHFLIESTASGQVNRRVGGVAGQCQIVAAPDGSAICEQGVDPWSVDGQAFADKLLSLAR